MLKTLFKTLDPIVPGGFQLYNIMKFVLSLKFVRVEFLSLSQRIFLTIPLEE
jgi:hypothetical protein